MIRITRTEANASAQSLANGVHTHRIYDAGTNTAYMVTMDVECAQLLEQELTEKDKRIAGLEQQVAKGNPVLVMPNLPEAMSPEMQEVWEQFKEFYHSRYAQPTVPANMKRKHPLTPDEAFIQPTVVEVVEHCRFKDGGTICYKDRNGRLYYVPAALYQLSGNVFHKSSELIEEHKLKGIALNIVQEFSAQPNSEAQEQVPKDVDRLDESDIMYDADQHAKQQQKFRDSDEFNRHVEDHL